MKVTNDYLGIALPTSGLQHTQGHTSTVEVRSSLHRS
jgi:hypothetical protein